MSIEEVTMNLASMALDAAQMRQTAIAANIANVNNPSYAPLSVSFEDQLDVARRTLQLGRGVDRGALSGVNAQWVSMPLNDAGDGSVQLDAEVAKLAANAVHFQTLLKAVSKHYGLLQLAVSEGKK